jgi:hypothetical protein
MTIQSGVSARGWLDEFSLGDNIAQLSRMELSVAQLIKTTIEDEAVRRVDAKRGGAIGLTSAFDDAAGKSHDALTDFPASSADRLLTYAHRATLGAPALSCLGIQETLNYVLSKDGDLTLQASTVGNGYGLELGHLLTAGEASSTGAEALTGFDDGAGAATDFGLQAYLHVFSFTGTSVTVTIEDSDDDAAVDPYAAVTGAAFTTVTGPTFERIQTSRTENVKEWLRVDLAGTYSAVGLAVVVVRNHANTVF